MNRPLTSRLKLSIATGMAVQVLLCAGCHRDMIDQPRYEALEASSFFPDGKAARLPPEGTVARGQLREDEPFHTGRAGNELVARLPVDVDAGLLARGEERFNIYCAVCHARTGKGNGMIVQRGFRRPPSFHTDRLRSAPAGHFFEVMTQGFGVMPSYRAQIPPRDRWAIVAYIRALQLSQHATLEDLPASERARLEEGTP